MQGQWTYASWWARRCYELKWICANLSWAICDIIVFHSASFQDILSPCFAMCVIFFYSLHTFSCNWDIFPFLHPVLIFCTCFQIANAVLLKLSHSSTKETPVQRVQILCWNQSIGYVWRLQISPRYSASWAYSMITLYQVISYWDIY